MHPSFFPKLDFFLPLISLYFISSSLLFLHYAPYFPPLSLLNFLLCRPVSFLLTPFPFLPSFHHCLLLSFFERRMSVLSPTVVAHSQTLVCYELTTNRQTFSLCGGFFAGSFEAVAPSSGHSINLQLQTKQPCCWSLHACIHNPTVNSN